MSQAVSRVPVERTVPSATAVVFTAMLTATVVGLVWIAAALSDPMTLPIRKVSVEGEFTYLDPEVLKVAVVDAVDAGFFGVDVADIRRRLLDEPWIREATIRRIWPDALHVRIVEQTPAARWGEQAMLNEVGDIFAPPYQELPTDLVWLDGPLGSEIEVLRQYHYLAQELSSANLDVVAVTVSPRFAWTLQTRDGKRIVLGRKDLRLRLRRFLFGYNRRLRDSWAQIGSVDLRYPNGFAVGARAAHTNPDTDSAAQPLSGPGPVVEELIDG